MLCVQYLIPEFTEINFLPSYTFFFTIIFLHNYVQNLLLKVIETAQNYFCKQASFLIMYFIFCNFCFLKTEGGIAMFWRLREVFLLKYLLKNATNQPNQLMVLVLTDFFLSINNTIMLVPLYSWFGIDSLSVHDAAGRYSPKSYAFLGFCQGTCGP